MYIEARDYVTSTLFSGEINLRQLGICVCTLDPLDSGY